MLSFDEALNRLLAAARPVDSVRTLPLDAAAERVLAAPVISPIAVPPLANSAMDGYAVRAADIPSAGTVLMVSQRIVAGDIGTPFQPGTAARIFTGAPIPPGADSVVMQEQCVQRDGEVAINTTPATGDNVRPAGEDFAAGQELLAAGVRLRASELALLAAAGTVEVSVFRRLRVGMFFTGNELRQPGEPLSPGAIYNSNRYALRALVESLGCELRDYGQVADDLASTRHSLRLAAAENDVVVTSGGVSVGEEDHVKAAVEAEGRLDLWKLAIKPGKPLAFGEIIAGGRRAQFIGLPGNPVSAFVTFVMLVRPFLLRRQGLSAVLPSVYRVPSGFDWGKPGNRTEFLRARLDQQGGAELYPNQGSGLLSSLAWATGLVRLQPGQTVHRGELVGYIPLSEVR